MPVYLLTGKLGSGKSLAAVARAAEYVEEGRRVVANFHMDLGRLAWNARSVFARAVVEVLPDRPTADDLLALGRGGPREDRSGLLILDECATWLNARRWQGSERERIIDWFLHSRKRGWDVILICQHPSALDKQVRELICEYLVVCRRLDRFRVPVVGVRMPRIHVATVRYGLSNVDVTAERWVYRGTRYYDCYSTLWISGHQLEQGRYSVLSAWHTRFRHQRRVTFGERLWRVPLLGPVLGITWSIAVGMLSAFFPSLAARSQARSRTHWRFSPSTWLPSTTA